MTPPAPAQRLRHEVFGIELGELLAERGIDVGQVTIDR
jgi:hypothetical protein